VLGVVYPPPARELVEASEAYDFVPISGRYDLPPHGIENVEIEFVQAAAHLAFLAVRPPADVELPSVGSHHNWGVGASVVPNETAVRSGACRIALKRPGQNVKVGV